MLHAEQVLQLLSPFDTVAILVATGKFYAGYWGWLFAWARYALPTLQVMHYRYYCTLIPASRITLLQRCVSFFRNAPNSAGVEVKASAPTPSKRSCTSGDFST